MLTEKAIRDSVFCPMLWSETDKTDKRIKGFPRILGPVDIKKALEEGEPNKMVMLESDYGEVKATSYQAGSDLWVTSKIGEEAVLLAVREVVLSTNKTLTVRRVLWREPMFLESVEAETHIQRILWVTFRRFFPKNRIIVESRFQESPRSFIISRAPTAAEIAEAREFVEWVGELAYGEVPLSPKHENCQWCKFDLCSERSPGPNDPLRQGGTPRPGVL